jgi:arginase
LYTLSKYSGMGGAPAALRTAGLVRSLNVTDDLGDVSIRPLPSDIIEGKAKNFTHFKESTLAVYDVARGIEAVSVIVLGGECSETVGVTAGLAERFGGRPGMLWMDAHGDFNTPETSPSGYIGGMCLAMATGRGPRLGLGPREAPLTDERLVHMGSRALDPPEEQAFASSPVKLVTARELKKIGAADAAKSAVGYLQENSDWIACHLDVDVMDPTQMPAVNYPTPGGITMEEASTVLKTLVRSEEMRLLEVAAYNSSLDRERTSLQKIARLLEMAFH